MNPDPHPGSSATSQHASMSNGWMKLCVSVTVFIDFDGVVSGVLIECTCRFVFVLVFVIERKYGVALGLIPCAGCTDENVREKSLTSAELAVLPASTFCLLK